MGTAIGSGISPIFENQVGGGIPPFESRYSVLLDGATQELTSVSPNMPALGPLAANLVQNGDFSEIGSNLITNGDFETPVSVSEWANFASPTTAERTTEKAYTGSYSYHIVGDGSNDGTQCAAGQFTGDYSIGDIVKITAYVYPITAASNQIKTGISNSGRGIFTAYSVTLNEWNKVEYYATITTASNNYITFLIAGTAGEFYLDDVSAQIVDPNGYWTPEGTWSIEEGVSRRTAALASDYELKQTFTTANSKTWEVSFEITEVSAGGCGMRLDGGTVGTYYTTVGVKTETITGTGTATDVIVQADATFVGAVTNVSVREIGTGDWSWSFWFKMPTVASGTNQRTFFLQGDTNNASLYVLATGKIQFGSVPWNDSSTYVFSDDTWYHVCYVADRSNSLGGPDPFAYYYVNGIFSDGKNLAGLTTPFDTTGRMRIGVNGAGAQPYGGNLDEVSIWSKALSAAEVASLYNGGTPTNLSGRPYLQNWWRMGDPQGPAAYPTILDVANPSLGSELVPPNFVGWSTTGDAAITDGKVVFTNANEYTEARNTSGDYLVSGNTYKLVIDIESQSGTGDLAYRYDGGSVTTITGGAGVKTVYFTAPSNGEVWIQTNGIPTNLSAVINSVSVKQVQGITLTMDNMSSSNIVPDAP